ncbi:MAG: hypothetical protein JNN24_18475 [Hyphomicrobium zavarzinii]|jgi:hypothetical protein|uniref:hypothetical protein n=1 Tax=Hyphomicrobium TaxID=81 RepID=UPI0012EC5880|nr:MULTISPECIES: hypothetical protein [Hyphomicrobium]MBL8847754.1 hypothetical protein [Hyphomicrobium zavarzinii]WBT39274.1 hypothetical protein PE058_05180 [Hyphomicrobium sp. DMF-1]HML41976.1 hypothetical protein [Hyphomicrobium zavarzinii]
MQLSANLRARISALGELSRPLGETRATALARALVNAVATDVAHGRDPQATIDGWIRRIAAEIVEKAPTETATPRKPAGPRRIGDVLPEIH